VSTVPKVSRRTVAIKIEICLRAQVGRLATHRVTNLFEHFLGLLAKRRAGSGTQFGCELCFDLTEQRPGLSDERSRLWTTRYHDAVLFAHLIGAIREHRVLITGAACDPSVSVLETKFAGFQSG
jgi:hypothetical protein